VPPSAGYSETERSMFPEMTVTAFQKTKQFNLQRIVKFGATDLTEMLLTISKTIQFHNPDGNTLSQTKSAAYL